MKKTVLLVSAVGFVALVLGAAYGSKIPGVKKLATILPGTGAI